MVDSKHLCPCMNISLFWGKYLDTVKKKILIKINLTNE